MSGKQISNSLLALIEEFNASTTGLDHKAVQQEEVLRNISTLSRKITATAERPEDVIVSQAFGINLNMCIRVCIDLNIFTTLVQKSSPVTARELGEITGAQEVLIIRLMRAVIALNFASELGVSTYIANAVTRAITDPSISSGFALIYDIASRPSSNLSAAISFLKENGYRCPTSAINGPFQRSHNCIGTTAFDYWLADPVDSVRFNAFMDTVKGSNPSWITWFPVEDHLLKSANMDDSSVLFVDVSGGHGDEIRAFAKMFPSAPGRLILQDLDPVLEYSLQRGDTYEPRIERQSRDFFTPQTITGARVYFMRTIMHDWPDDDCVRILRPIAKAMRPGYSKLLINDLILPEVGTSLISAALDITMMVHHSGMERSEKMWKTLIGRVEGLKIVKFWYPPDGKGVVEVELEEDDVDIEAGQNVDNSY